MGLGTILAHCHGQMFPEGSRKLSCHAGAGTHVFQVYSPRSRSMAGNRLSRLFMTLGLSSSVKFGTAAESPISTISQMVKPQSPRLLWLYKDSVSA